MTFDFTTIWRIAAPVEPIWAEIENYEGWSDWWDGVLRVEKLGDGDKDGVGAIYRSTWKSVLPYKITFDSEVLRVEHLRTIEARAFGQLEGKGVWQFASETDNITRVRYNWRVKSTKAWMNLIAPVAEPVFKWNHDVLMKWGGEALAEKLDCRLL